MIRPYREEDFEIVAKFWFAAIQAAEPEIVQRMGYEFTGAREYFKTVVTENQMWVYELNNIPIGILGIQNDYIDRLYVDQIIIGAALAKPCSTMPVRSLLNTFG